MGELYFKVELLDDVVLSQRTATVGDHKSLDYIPGSVFLGIAASKLYSKESKDEAWSLFHTSQIRFYNAYPMISGKRTIPMPLSFHSEKVPRDGKEHEILNFVYSDAKENGVQYKQNRNGYVFFDDGKISVTMPSKTSRMRTAIDAETGTAEKAQLYCYESLDAGQIFIGKIEWDDSINGAVSAVADLFEKEQTFHIGRSKTASYGRVKISKVDAPKINSKSKELNDLSFSILAVSDLCLRNPVTGTPELSLFPDFLGLDSEWRLDGTRSFARPSYLYQYNAYRKEIEVQKTLISKGSVFTFQSDKEITATEKDNILKAIKQGIGDARGQGFGEIALFNVEKVFQKDEINDDNAIESQSLSKEEQSWLEWVKPVFISTDVREKVETAVKEFVKICKSIKKFHSFDDDFIFWPGNNQWGRILETARECNSKNDLYKLLFEGDTPIIKPIKETQTERNQDTKISNPDSEWNYEASGDGKTLREWLMDFVDKNNMSDKDIKIALQELVKRCKDKIADKNWLKDGTK